MGRSRALGPLILASLALAAPAAAKPLVTLHQTGGFAGVDETLGVKQSRAASFTERGHTDRFTVGKKRMHRLRVALNGWEHLKTAYPADQPVADGFQYAITHAAHTVRTEDGAAKPRKLERVLALLHRIETAR
jgi:hypothetical protein